METNNNNIFLPNNNYISNKRSKIRFFSPKNNNRIYSTHSYTRKHGISNGKSKKYSVLAALYSYYNYRVFFLCWYSGKM